MGIFQPAMLLYRSVPHWKTCDKLCQIFPKICTVEHLWAFKLTYPSFCPQNRGRLFLVFWWRCEARILANLASVCGCGSPTNGTRKVDKVALYEAKLMRLSLSNINQSSKCRQNGESCNVSEWKSKMRTKLKIIKFEQPVLFYGYGSKGKFNFLWIELTEHDTFHHEPSWNRSPRGKLSFNSISCSCQCTRFLASKVVGQSFKWIVG